VKNWAYPEAFAEICNRHHEPFSQRDPELLRLVKTACRIADALGFSAATYTKVCSYQDILSGLPAALRSRTLPSEKDMSAKVEARLKALEG
jgi:hypothetical protein